MTLCMGPSLSDGMTFSRAYHLDQYAEWMRSWSASASTLTQRISAARRAARRWPDPARVLASDIAAWLASEQFSPWTRLTYHGHLRSLFGWLAQVGIIKSDPTATLRRPAKPRRNPRPLSPDEVTLALRDARGDLRAWLVLGLYAGLRAHETAKLHGSHVTETSLFVRGKGGKDAVLPTHPLVWELAQTRPREGYWFPGGWTTGHVRRAHVDPRSVTAAVTRHFKALGIEGSYHRARHSYGTNLIRAGADILVVRDLMRHDSVKTTEGYLDVDESERAAAIRLLSA